MCKFLKKITIISMLSIAILFLVFNVKNNKNTDFNRNSVDCDQKTITLDCEIRKSFLKTELKGLLYTYRDNFKFIIYKNSIKQVEAGRNENYFWYWSKDESPDRLFYSKKEHMVDVFKKSLNIVWLLETLQNKEFTKYDGENNSFYICRIYKKDLIFSYFIDKKSKEIKKYELSDQKNKIAEALILSNSEIKYIFFEPNINININIKITDAFKNEIDESVFVTPFSEYKILNEMIPTCQEPF